MLKPQQCQLVEQVLQERSVCDEVESGSMLYKGMVEVDDTNQGVVAQNFQQICGARENQGGDVKIKGGGDVKIKGGMRVYVV